MPRIAPGGSGTAQVGASNKYPPSQCTWWADNRYHQLTGYYVPWPANQASGGDAHDWLAGALASGWETSASPPSDTPSIIVLQAGVQQADPIYGHVGVVESINADGSVSTSDLNWGLTQAERAQVTTITFQIGHGVNFIWVAGQPASPTPVSDWLQNAVNTAKNAKQVLSPSSDIASVLYTLDQALLITNPFDLTSQQNADIQDSIPVITGISGATLPDPLRWLGIVGTNFFHDSTAAAVRLAFLLLGGLVLFKVFSAFIDIGAIADTAQKSASSVAGLAKVALL